MVNENEKKKEEEKKEKEEGGERERDRPNRTGAGSSSSSSSTGVNNDSAKGNMVLPPHLLTSNDYERFNDQISGFFGEGNMNLSFHDFKQLFTKVNKEIASTAEVTTVLKLTPSKDIPLFLRNVKIMDFSGGITMANRSLDTVSSGVTTYYKLPGKLFQFLYENSDSIISAINSFNVGGGGQTILPQDFRSLI
jgi:hypothetical protein